MCTYAYKCLKATSDLIAALRNEAEIQRDEDTQRHLLSAAKSLADATTQLIEAAKVFHI